MKRRQSLPRRKFLYGIGGVAVGIPLLEALDGSTARAQEVARSPFLTIILGGNGVVQRGQGGEAEMFWPTATGELTQQSLAADNAERTTGELADYAERLLMVRGVKHHLGENGCNHASGSAQVLTGSNLLNSGNKTVAAGESIDTLVARELNEPGREPLFLHAGRYSAGGTAYNVPSYVSYVGSGQQRTGIASPIQAYERMVGLVDVTTEVRDLVAARRTSVNDLLREQIQGLLSRTDLTTADRSRLDQHFTAIRDLEVAFTSAAIADTALEEMRAVDERPYDMVNHETIIRLHMQLMVFAISSGYTNVAVLQVGDREDDHVYEMEGKSVHFHDVSHRRAGDWGGDPMIWQHKIDRLQAQNYKSFLDQLDAIDTPTGSLLDQGLATWTNQIGTGPDHYLGDIPWIIAGGAQGRVRQGAFLQVTASTNAMLTSLAQGVGIELGGFGASEPDSGSISDMLV